MKIEIPKQTDQASIGNFESMEAGIDKASLPFVLEMLSKNFYSNPIGSTVREITSNCFDSHSEANVDEPVIVEISGTDERFVSFRDFGVGLSPDRIKNIYLNYFSSTKRSTDEQIGGFGLGSKSPLSYTDYFNINTIFEGIRYEYIFSKGDTLPTLDLLVTEETTEKNGTEIKIPILKKDDEYRFIEEMKAQLSYFDNVYFIGCGIDNEYRIYEGVNFKYRNKDQYSDVMHICFGKVAYPIDWKQLKRDYLEIPVAVKFNIGELVVTPNREALRYTDKVISLVNERIDKTLQELKDLYESQADSHDDFRKWWTTKRENKSILLGEDRLKSPEFKKFKRNSIFIPFEGLNIEDFKIDDPLRYLYNFNKRIDGRNWKVVDEVFDYSRNLTDFFLDSTNRLCYCKDTNFSNIKSFNNKNCRLVSRKHIRAVVNNILPYKKWSYGFGHLPIYEDMAMKSLHAPQKEAFHFIANRKDAKGKDIDDDHYFNLGLSIRLYKFIKFFRTLLESQVKDYHRPISTDVAEQYEIIKLENDGTLRRKLEQKVFVKLINNDSEFDWSIADIEQFTGLVVYGSMEDRNRLERAHTFLGMRNSLVAERISGSSYKKIRELNPDRCKLIRVAKNNFKHFKNKTNMIHVKDLYSDNRLFRQVASSYKIENVLKELLKHYSNVDTKRFINFYSKINEDIGNRLNNLYRYYKKFHNNERLQFTTVAYSELKLEILTIATKLNLFDPIVEEDILVINKYFEGIELIKYIDLNNETLPVILKYLREKKKKINLDYYTRFVPPSQPGDQLSIDFEPIQETKFKIITEAA